MFKFLRPSKREAISLSTASNSIYSSDTVKEIKTDGTCILSSGRIANALSDEKLNIGDKVMLIKDSIGKLNILAGKK